MQTVKSIYKLARWVILAMLVIAGVLMLRRPAPAAAPLAPEVRAEKAKEFEQSLAQLEAPNTSGAPAEARFDSDQVNSFIAVASAEATKQAAAAGATTATQSNPESGEFGQVSSSQVAFSGDIVTAQAVAQRYGRDIYVTVSGHVGANDGYVTFEPTEFKVGSLTVPVALVNPSLQRMLRQPEVRERMKLPAFISELRVENGELVIVKK